MASIPSKVLILAFLLSPTEAHAEPTAAWGANQQQAIQSIERRLNGLQELTQAYGQQPFETDALANEFLRIFKDIAFKAGRELRALEDSQLGQVTTSEMFLEVEQFYGRLDALLGKAHLTQQTWEEGLNEVVALVDLTSIREIMNVRIRHGRSIRFDENWARLNAIESIKNLISYVRNRDFSEFEYCDNVNPRSDADLECRYIFLKAHQALTLIQNRWPEGFNFLNDELYYRSHRLLNSDQVFIAYPVHGY